MERLGQNNNVETPFPSYISQYCIPESSIPPANYTFKKKKKKKIKAVQQILPNKSCVERLILNFKKLGFIKKKKKKKKC